MSPEKEEIRRARSILRAALEASGGGPLDKDESLVTMASRAALHLDGWQAAAKERAEVAAWRGPPIQISEPIRIPAQTYPELGYPWRRNGNSYITDRMIGPRIYFAMVLYDQITSVWRWSISSRKMGPGFGDSEGYRSGPSGSAETLADASRTALGALASP